ncbi:MAG: hypothetical protein FJ095_01450 [Deltaproteobacteria bacterium]|nr:hypothetical protein [Deltaproteobacteria bacterium]
MRGVDELGRVSGADSLLKRRPLERTPTDHFFSFARLLDAAARWADTPAMLKHVLWATACAIVACGGQAASTETPASTAAPTEASAPSSESSAAASAAPTSESAPAVTAAPSAAPTSEADAGRKASPPSGRPAIQVGPSKKIASTFGATPGSVLKLKTSGGELVLKLQEYSLRVGANLVFEVGGPKVMRGKANVIGDIVHLSAQVGDSTRMSFLDAYSAPFVVLVPSKKSVNLAIGELELDEAGQETKKVKDWRVVAPLRFDAGLSQVVFELDRIGPSVMHATAAEPTAAPAK